MTDFITYCKDYVADHLCNFEGRNVDTYDLSIDITNGPNMDGTLTYSREEARDYLRAWWDEAGDYYEWEKSNFGEGRNPFDDPEGYMVCMVIEGVRTLIDQALAELNESEDDRIELTPERIERIIELVNENDTARLF